MINPRSALPLMSGLPGATDDFRPGPDLAEASLELADRGAVARLKPVLKKRSTIEARALSLRSAGAASMTDQELETALAENWTESLGWEVTRRIMVARLAALREAESADDIEAAEAEIAREG